MNWYAQDSAGMAISLREAWTGLVDAGDYERHMAAVGQAQANAEMVAGVLRSYPPPAGAAVWFAGAGTGQLFEFRDPSILTPWRMVFTDINRGYLKRLAARVKRAERVRFLAVVDDIERCGLRGGFPLVIAVLLLEQVDWRAAAATLARLSTSRVFIGIQENPPDLSSALTRPVKDSMAVFRDARPRLIQRDELAREFDLLGFGVRQVVEKPVADGKKMVGILFERKSGAPQP
jgi:hypothetical protein